MASFAATQFPTITIGDCLDAGYSQEEALAFRENAQSGEAIGRVAHWLAVPLADVKAECKKHKIGPGIHTAASGGDSSSNKKSMALELALRKSVPADPWSPESLNFLATAPAAPSLKKKIAAPKLSSPERAPALTSPVTSKPVMSSKKAGKQVSRSPQGKKAKRETIASPPILDMAAGSSSSSPRGKRAKRSADLPGWAH